MVKIKTKVDQVYIYLTSMSTASYYFKNSKILLIDTSFLKMKNNNFKRYF